MNIPVKRLIITPNPDLILGKVYLNPKQAEIFSENKLLNAALFYAKLGLPVFPLHNFALESRVNRCSCRDWKECNKPAKHPRTRFGHKEATTSEKKIRDWWAKHPNSNIGLLTGVQTGLLVLDVDWKHGGEQSLEYMQEDYKTLLKHKYSPLPATLTTTTGSGGRHLYFKFPADLRDISGSASDIGEGLDIRANENYIIVPPSKHESGKEYSWFGVNTPIDDAPDWLIYEVIKSSEPKLKINKPVVTNTSKTPVSERIPEGKRYDYLFRQVCGLVNSYSDKEVLNQAVKINDNSFETPLPDKEVNRLVNDVCKRYGNSAR
ncbi:MAG TPA: bifunctional DNA primase/polymerase [Pyrinomonadaceae bacterium]|jgi:putative DNA primase/helicase